MPAVLPSTLNEITPAWLTGVLSRRHQGLRVRSVVPTAEVDGTAMKAMFRLEYEDPQPDLPRDICIKGGLGILRDRMLSKGLYRTEARVYDEILPLLDIRTPFCLGVDFDDTQQGLAILEDLRTKAVFNNATEPLTPEQVADGLSQYAKLHARWWNDTAFLDSLDIPLHSPHGKDRDNERTLRTPEHWAMTLSLPRAQAVPRFAKDLQRITAGLDRVREIDHGHITLLHGDTHVGNTYLLQDGRIGVMDFQTMRRGPWGHDVNTFIISALDMDDRRRFEKDLVKGYLDCLKAAGAPAPDFQAGWDNYTLHTVYQLFFWIANIVQMQTEMNCIACASRFGVAAMDHDTFTRLGV